MKNRNLLIILIVLFIINLTLVVTGITMNIDSNISLFFSQNIYEVLTVPFKFISFICSPKVMIILNIILFIYILIKKKYQLSIIIVSSLTSVTINNLIKIIVRRDRPNYLRLVEETSFSFPSGHTMIATLFFGSVIYLINKNNVKHKKLITILLSTFIFLVGVSRIYLGVHYLSDVLAGFMAGLILLLLIIIIYERIEQK